MAGRLNLGTLVYLLDLDGDPFEKGLKGIDKRAGQAGSSLTKSLTLPLAAAGVAAVKMSTDFETVFSRMQGLAGVSADEVDGLKESVLGLAGETGKGPQELAEGLYFIRSAGLSGQDALDALKASAMGAAAGLGTTADVAGVVTSAMNAYASSGLTAAQATDQLVAAVAIGKVEASELGPQLGRLLPVAASLGIRFSDVAASVGFLSRTSGDASLSATQFGGVLAKLLSPGQQGKKVLDEIGLSLDRLKGVAAAGGPVEAMELLRTSLDKSGLSFADFAEDQQFIQGALGMTGVNAKAAQEAIDAGRNSADMANKAFSDFAETAGFKNSQAFAQLQAALIEVGDVLVPLVADIAGFATKMLAWFSSLPEPAKTLVVALGGLLAVTGPLLTVGSRVHTVMTGVSKALTALSPNAMAAGGSLSNLGKNMAALGPIAAAVALGPLLGEMTKQRVDVDRLATSLANLTGARRKEAEELVRGLDSLGQLDSTMKTMARTNMIGAERFLEVAQSAGLSKDKLNELKDILDTEAAHQKQSAEDTKTNADAHQDAAAAADDQRASLEDLADQLQAMFDPIFAMQDALASETEARAALNAAVAEHGAKSTEAAQAEADLLRALADTDAAALGLATAIDAGTTSLEQGVEQLNTWVASGRLTRAQADRIAEGIGIATSTAENFSGTYTAKLEADTSDVEAKVAALKGKLNELGMFAASARENATGTPAPKSKKKSHDPPARAMGGDVWAGQSFLVGEDGPELVRFSGTGHVFDAATSRSMLNARPSMAPAAHVAVGGGGYVDNSITNVPIAFHGNAGSRSDRDELRRIVQEATDEANRRSGSRRPSRYRG